MDKINRSLIDLAYFINASVPYQKKKRFFSNLLENSDYKYKKYFDIFMIFLVFSSISIFIHSVKHTIPEYLDIFNTYLLSIIFLVEYILRLWITSSISKVVINQDEYSDLLDKPFEWQYVIKRILKDKLQFIISVRAIIDLLAILPFFQELRLLRVFILFRVFKLFRYAKSVQLLTSILVNKKFEFITLGMFAGIVIFVSSVLIYAMEANEPGTRIVSLYEAFYWSIVTISTVGYGDITPISKEGQFVAMLVIISGISVLAFTTSLFVSSFTEKIDDIKENKVINDISKQQRLYIVCGYENIAKEVVKKLLKADYSILVIDESLQRVEEAKKDGVTALHYNPGYIDSYSKLNVDLTTQVKAILCLRENDVENVYTALTIRSINKDVQIMSLLMKNENRGKLIHSGVNEILYDKEFVGVLAKEYVGQAVAFEAIHAFGSAGSVIKINEIAITERILEHTAFVKELENIKYRIVLLGIYKKSRGRFFFNPLDDTLLEVGDILVVVGNYMFIREFIKFLISKSV